MNSKHLSWLLTAVLLTTTHLAEAQRSRDILRIGYLAGSSATAVAARTEALRQRLRELGYVEGKNIVIEARYAEGTLDRLAALADELVHLKVDVIVTGGPSPTRAAREATTTIPIVMGLDNDPVGSGFVASLARPGGNVTGLATLSPEISGKQLEIWKEIFPRLSRVAVIGTSSNPGNVQMLKETELAAKAFAVRLQQLDVSGPNEIETVFRAAGKGRAEAVIVLPNLLLLAHRAQLAHFAARSRLPTMYGQSEYVDAGSLIFYGASINDLFRRAATYVDKILKGARPADLPVEQPTKFELVINLKAAKQMGLTIPPNVLARANRLIR